LEIKNFSPLSTLSKNGTFTCTSYLDPSRSSQTTITCRLSLPRPYSLVDKPDGPRKLPNMTSRLFSDLGRIMVKLMPSLDDLEISLKRGMIALALYKP
jgi:hypothetical protein